MKVPTDLHILQSIYNKYYCEFEAFKTGQKNSRVSKVYVPINVDLIGEELGNSDTHVIQFPYMASVLADLQYENRKYITATTVAWVSTGISLFAVLVAMLAVDWQGIRLLLN